MYYFNIILTENCNANCSHCYMASNKKNKKQLSYNQIDTLIKKLPNEIEGITLTGGEVFVKRKLLEYTIINLKKKFTKTKVEIESNGIYLYNGDTLKKLKELKSIGVDSIRLSLDSFHEDGGINLEKVKNIKNYECESTPVIRFLVQEKAIAFGKAKELSKDRIENKNCMNSEKTPNKTYLFLDIEGNIFLCPWKISPSIGNIYAENFVDIIKRLDEPLFSNILVGNILEVCNSVKNDIENEKIVKNFGECYLCEKTFKGE